MGNSKNVRVFNFAIVLKSQKNRENLMRAKTYTFYSISIKCGNLGWNWNSLPYNVRNSVSITSFKRALKTFLFS